MGRTGQVIGTAVRAAAICALLASSLVSAQPAFNLEQLRLDPSGRGPLTLGAAETGAPGEVRLSAAVQYSRKPLLVDIALPVPVSAAPIRDRAVLHLTGALVLLPGLEVMAQLPVVGVQGGDDLSPYGVPPVATAGVGDASLSGRYVLPGARSALPVDLAGELAVGVPLGGGRALASDAALTFTPRLLASRRGGATLAAASVGVLVRPTVDVGTGQVGSQLELGLGVRHELTRVVAEVSLRSQLSFTGLPAGLELLFGGRYKPSPDLELYAVAGPGFGQAPGTPAFRVLGGVGWHPFARPPAPAPAPPPPPPPPPPPLVTKALPPLTQPPPPDADADGIEDAKDACPAEAGVTEARGCPIRDGDADGTPDHLDNCLKVAGPPKNQGCPVKEKQLVRITRERLYIRDKVYFAFGKATLLPKSYKLLDQVAKIILEHPTIPRVVVEGHTDSLGNAEVNRRLSRERAAIVRQYLEKKGIPPGKLESRGYGPDRPAATNATPEGREENRRVEFIVTDDAPAEP
jgi:outer membrane protein OmpA-like peptidoglycan-associated protein